MAIEPSSPLKYCSSIFCACSKTANPMALRFTVWPATARMCCTPVAESSASRSSTLNSKRACRLASCRGNWRRSSGLDRTVGFPLLARLVLAYRFKSDLVLLDLTVKARPVNAKHICSFLLVSASSLKGTLDHELLDFFERHVGRDV